MWVRKSCGNLSNAGHDSLLPQGRHRLPYLIALSLHPLFGSYCSMREILSRNLCTLLGKATNEVFFSYPKMTSNVTDWQGIRFSLQNRLNECLNTATITLGSGHLALEVWWEAIHHLRASCCFPSSRSNSHQLE